MGYHMTSLQKISTLKIAFTLLPNACMHAANPESRQVHGVSDELDAWNGESLM